MWERCVLEDLGLNKNIIQGMRMEGEWEQGKNSLKNRITKGMWIDFRTPKRRKGSKTINLE